MYVIAFEGRFPWREGLRLFRCHGPRKRLLKGGSGPWAPPLPMLISLKLCPPSCSVRLASIAVSLAVSLAVFFGHGKFTSSKFPALEELGPFSFGCQITLVPPSFFFCTLASCISLASRILGQPGGLARNGPDLSRPSV